MEKNWFALYTKPRHEFKAEVELNELEIECFLPQKTEISQWSDRKKKITKALIPGYIFINATEKDRLNALQIKPVLNTVCFEGKPSKIPNWEIENLRDLLSKSPNVEIVDYFAEGEKVEIIDGVMSGIQGFVFRRGNGDYLGIRIDAIRQGFVVKIERANLKKL